MELKCVQVLLIGICCGFLTCCISQMDIQRQKVWCEGVNENTYLRNATDCRVWIRCNGPNYPPSSGFCPNPSFFSVEQQRCTSQNDANCFVCPDTTSSSYETVANSCNRFIHCNNGVPSETSCGIGMGFNPETNRCEGAYYQTCIAKTATTTATPNTSTATIKPSTAAPNKETSTSPSTIGVTTITTTPANPTPKKPFTSEPF